MIRISPILVALTACMAAHANTITNAAALSRQLMTSDGIATRFSLPAATATWCMHIPHNTTILTLSDDSGTALATYQSCDRLPLISPGDIISISGKLTAKYHPAAEITDAAIIRHGPAPTPVQASLHDIVNGLFDWQLAHVSGFVREAVKSDTNDLWMHMALCDNGCLLHLSVPLNNANPEVFYGLIGAKVSAVGICNPQDKSNKLYQGRIFQCTGLDALQIIAPKSDDPFDCPTIKSLRYRQPFEIAMLGAHRTSGRVLAVWRKNHALIRADTDELVHLILATNIPPRINTSIDAAGFPESSLFNLILSHASWRYAASSPSTPETPVRLEAKASALSLASLHGQSVSIEGIVTRMPESMADDGMLIIEQQGDFISIDVSALSNLPTGLAKGCRVRGTGIYLIEPDLKASSFLLPRITGSVVILRSTEDLVVLAPPKWWTTRKLLIVIASLAFILMALSFWNILLRRLSEKRGNALAAETIAHAETDLKVLERTRLAADLHDVIAQNLTGIALEIETARQFLEGSRPELRQHLTVASQSLRSCRQELRNCLWDLRSHALEEPDMDAAIRHTLPLHLKDVKFSLRFEVPRKDLTDNTAHMILRIIRELAHNAVQHGKATVVKIAGCIDNEQLLFSVQDNGCGFDPDDCPDGAKGHFGLEGIRERIRPLHGNLVIFSEPGKGSRAVVTIPLRYRTSS